MSLGRLHRAWSRRGDPDRALVTHGRLGGGAGAALAALGVQSGGGARALGARPSRWWPRCGCNGGRMRLRRWPRRRAVPRHPVLDAFGQAAGVPVAAAGGAGRGAALGCLARSVRRSGAAFARLSRRDRGRGLMWRRPRRSARLRRRKPRCATSAGAQGWLPGSSRCRRCWRGGGSRCWMPRRGRLRIWRSDGLARIARGRAGRRLVPRGALPAMLTGWQAEGLLRLAAREPERVLAGPLALSEFRRRGRARLARR